MFTFINSLNLEITFDTVAVEEQLPSVAFQVTAKWEMPNQQAQIVIKESWFEYSELNQFEENLLQLVKRQIDFVKLPDISSKSVLQFSQIDD